jgi:membrane protein DedA with SNARE-associated domain
MPGLELTEWARSVLTSLGYPGIVLLLVIETVFPPIPSEIILPLSGFLASEGEFQIVLLIIVATFGSVLGSLILYAVGRTVSMPRLYRLFDRWGRYFLTGTDDLVKAETWFQRHRRWAVVIGRLMPGIRSLISIPAGLAHMSILEFCVLTAIGSGIWNTLLIGAGWLLGSQWEDASEYTDVFEYIVLGAIALVVIAFVSRRLWERCQAPQS